MNSYRLVVPKRGYMPDFFHVGWWFGSISVTFSPNYHTRFTSLPNHLPCYFPTHCPSTYCVFFICQISTFSSYFWGLIFVSIWWLDTIFHSDTLLQCNAAAAKRRCNETPLGLQRAWALRAALLRSTDGPHFSEITWFMLHDIANHTKYHAAAEYHVAVTYHITYCILNSSIPFYHCIICHNVFL